MAGLRTRRREGLVLLVTAVSVAALVGAGFSSYGDPDLAGRAALARLSSEVTAGLVGEWEQLRRDPDLLSGAGRRWATVPAPAHADSVELEFTVDNVVVDALLAESRRLDHEERDPERALGVLLETFDKELDDARRAAARLRAIQLAVRCDQHATAVEQWRLARAELSGFETIEGTSALLLCALAAAPALTLEERAALREVLVTRWIAGELALPPESFGGDPLRAAFRDRVQALVPDSTPDARLEQHRLHERARCLADLAGRTLSPPDDGGFGLERLGEDELILRRVGEETIEGVIQPRGTLARRFADQASRAEVLSSGFSLDPDGTRSDAGPIVRERIALAHGPQGLLLRHSNPESVVSEVGERQALLRAALFVLAAGVGAAGFAMFRALRRERHLADLKSAFVANVSHELRTPVSSILLMAENLEDERVEGAEARQRYHGLIRREAARLRHLVDDVLDFSRIERGKGVHLSPTELDVADFSRALEGEARERVTAAGGELRFHANGVPERIVADADALRRATMNLVDNSLKHSGASNVEVELHGDDEAERGGLVIQVRDHGTGVPAARLESLFRPFERLEDPRGSNGVAGTGLGLAIVREIAEGHGGRASARLPSGPGLLFEIRVPARPPEERR